MSNGFLPNPIPAPNIPSGYCNDPLNLHYSLRGNFVTFIWDSPHDNDGFYLSYKQGASPAVQITVFGSGIEIELLPNVSYTWSVRTMCNRLTNVGSNVVNGPGFITGDLIPSCPVINANTILVANGSTNVRFEWPFLLNINRYDVEIQKTGTNQSLPFTAETNYITIYALLSNTDYQFRVKPQCNDSKWSSWKTFKTSIGKANAETTINRQVYSTNALIYFTPIKDALGYVISLNNTVLYNPTLSTIFNFSNLFPATNYTVLITPIYEEGYGNVISYGFKTENSPINVPSNLTLEFNNQNELVVSWNYAENIDSQILNINGSSFELGNTTSGYVVENTIPNYKYLISLYSVQNGNKSVAITSSVVAPSFCKTPTNYQVLNNYPNKAIISWNKTNAGSYNLYYKLSVESDWTSVGNTTSTEYTLSSLQVNTDYDFKIVPICSNIDGTPLLLSFTTTDVPQSLLPITLAINSVTHNGIVVSFDLDGNLSPYNGLFEAVASDGINPNIVVAGTQSPILIPGLLSDTTYTITVTNKETTNNATSLPITQKTNKDCLIAATLTGTPQTNNNDLLMTWAAVVGVVGYIPKYKPISAIDWIILPQQVGVTKSLVGIGAGIYDIAVTSVFADGRQCDKVTTSTIPQILNVSVDTPGKNIAILWDAVKDVDHYLLSVVAIGNNILLEVQSNSQYLELEPETNYAITVKAVRNGVEGAASTVLNINTGTFVYDEQNCVGPEIEAFKQDAAINNPDLVGCGKQDVTVFINDYNPDYSYIIELIMANYAAPAITDEIVVNAPNESGVKTYYGLPAGAINAKVKIYSNGVYICQTIKAVKDTTCVAPTALAGSNITDVSVDLTWTISPSANAYEIYLEDVVAGTGYILNNTITGNAFTVTGLTALTQYNIKVRSICGPSIFSGYTTVYNFTTLAPM